MNEEKEEKLSRAVSAYSRRQMLRLLIKKEMTVKDLAQQTNLSMSLTSRHLSLLRDLGFIEVRKELPHKFYSLKIKDIQEFLTQYDKVIRQL